MVKKVKVDGIVSGVVPYGLTLDQVQWVERQIREMRFKCPVAKKAIQGDLMEGGIVLEETSEGTRWRFMWGADF